MTPFPLIDASQLPAVTARPAVVLRQSATWTRH
jgi:hypothetical protein